MENENYKGITPASEDQQLQNNSQQPVEDEMDEEAAAKEKLTSTDPTKVVFLSANSEYTRKNGDAKVDIENVQRNVGMGKEELLKYANQPFWARLRLTLFILFWVVWLAMLIGSVAIIVIVPGCAAAPRLQWWQKTTIYQVVVNSFKDSDGNKKGDLGGLTSKLDYFSDLKVDSLLLSPIFASADADTPNEIVNFTDVAQNYGTITDFRSFITKADENNMKVILEFVPNHTSDKHPWFIKSANGEEPYTDYYIWASGKAGSGEPGEPPNDWSSSNGVAGSAWTWNPQRKKYYLHQFHANLPDLNLRNLHLRQEMKNILLFWLDEGVDGFKVADVDYLFEDKDLRSETTQEKNAYTRRQSENLELLREWREILDNYTDTATEQKHPRILLTEAADTNGNRSLQYYYGHSEDPVVNIPYNLGLTSLTKDSTPHDLYHSLQKSFNATPEGLWPNFVLGTSQMSRLLSRVGGPLLDGLHMVTLLSKATPVVFFGDELGMEGGPSSAEGLAAGDVLMQWDNSTLVIPGDNDPNAPANYASINVKAEWEQPHSHLSVFRRVLGLREKPAIGFGVMEFPLVDNQVFSMLRSKKNTPGYLVVINFSRNDTLIDFSGRSELLPESANVELATLSLGYLKDAGRPKVYLNDIHLGPLQSAVLTFVPKDK